MDISYPLHDPMVIKIAEKHNKHPAQVSCPTQTPVMDPCLPGTVYFVYIDIPSQ